MPVLVAVTHVPGHADEAQPAGQCFSLAAYLLASLPCAASDADVRVALRGWAADCSAADDQGCWLVVQRLIVQMCSEFCEHVAVLRALDLFLPSDPLSEAVSLHRVRARAPACRFVLPWHS